MKFAISEDSRETLAGRLYRKLQEEGNALHARCEQNKSMGEISTDDIHALDENRSRRVLLLGVIREIKTLKRKNAQLWKKNAAIIKACKEG
jgi:hypothetical protein